MTRRLLLPFVVVAGIAAMVADLAQRPPFETRLESKEKKGGGPYPSDWFGLQRAFPYTTIPQGKFQAAFEHAQMERARRPPAPRHPVWTQAGPVQHRRARHRARRRARRRHRLPRRGQRRRVQVDQRGRQLDAGVRRRSACSRSAPSRSTPANPQVVYVGTGEANSSVDSYDGAGVFRSRTAGASWEHLGLAETARIGRGRGRSRRTRAASSSPRWARQFSTGPHRGLYRSEDGGQSWTKVLFVNDSTGRVRRRHQPGASRDGVLRHLGARAASHLPPRLRARLRASGAAPTTAPRGRGSRAGCPRPRTTSAASGSRSRRRGPR